MKQNIKYLIILTCCIFSSLFLSCNNSKGKEEKITNNSSIDEGENEDISNESESEGEILGNNNNNNYVFNNEKKEPSSEKGGSATFVYSIMNRSDFSYIVALGNINPPSHTFPTDHIYFVFKDPKVEYEVFAPSDGTITNVRYQPLQGYGDPCDYKITFRYSSTFYFYLDHVERLDPDISEKIGTISKNSSKNVQVTIKAGQRIGYTSGRGDILGAMDLGVINYEKPLIGFISPSRYFDQTIYCDSPLKYYAEPLKSELYALVERAGDDKDGRIDYDLAGKLAGNWFMDGLSNWNEQKHISFVYDNYNPTKMMISIGGELSISGAFYVGKEERDFASLSTESGTVKYTLYNRYEPSQVDGYLIVEMVDDNTIKVETSESDISNFSAECKKYVR